MRQTKPLGDEYRAIAGLNSIRQAIKESLMAEMPDLDEVDWPEGRLPVGKSPS